MKYDCFGERRGFASRDRPEDSHLCSAVAPRKFKDRVAFFLAESAQCDHVLPSSDLALILPTVSRARSPWIKVRRTAPVCLSGRP